MRLRLLAAAILCVAWVSASHAEPEVVTSTEFCFPEEERFVANDLYRFGSKITLEILPWASSRLLTRLLEILLREKLGYDVEVLSFRGHGTSEEAYRRLADGAVDVNMDLWPSSGESGRQYALASSKYVEMGELGYRGRSGWFLSVPSLQDLVPAISTYELWESLESIGGSALIYNLTTSWELPSSIVTSAPCDNGALTVSWHGGVLHCTDGSWTPSGPARCCSRLDHLANACPAENPRPCAALVVHGPLYDQGQNEERVAISGLPIEIIYYYEAQQLVEEKAAEGKPLLFYLWEPDLLFSQPNSFLRIGMREHLYCTTGSEAGVGDNRRSNMLDPKLHSNRSATCDFVAQNVHKAAWLPLKVLAPDAWRTISKVSANFVTMMHLQAENVRLHDPFDAACAFLNSSTLWRDSSSPSGPWAIPEKRIYDWAFGALGVLGFGIIYSIFRLNMFFCPWGRVHGTRKKVASMTKKVERQCAQTTNVVVHATKENVIEKAINVAESVTGRDLDRDGDIGVAGHYARAAAPAAPEQSCMSAESSTVRLGPVVVQLRETSIESLEDVGSLPITVARSRARDPAVDLERPVTVFLRTVDGSAKQGEDFGALQREGQQEWSNKRCKKETTMHKAVLQLIEIADIFNVDLKGLLVPIPEKQRVLAVTFQPGQLEVTVRVPILTNPAFSPTRSFQVMISHAENADLNAVGNQTRISLINMAVFPGNYRVTDTTSITQQLKLVFYFVLEMWRCDGMSLVMKKWHVRHITVAFITTLGYSLAFREFLAQVLRDQRVDWAIMLAAFMLAGDVYQFTVTSMWWHGGVKAEVFMQGLLHRRHLSLTTYDSARFCGMYEERFYSATNLQANILAFKVWAGAQWAIAECYYVVFHLAFLCVANGELAGIIFTLLVLSGAWFCSSRLGRAWVVARNECKSRVHFVSRSNEVLHSRDIIRQSNDIVDATERVRKAFVRSCGWQNHGVGWEARFYHLWFTQNVPWIALQVLIYLIWISAPYITSDARDFPITMNVPTFLAVIGSIRGLGKRIINLIKRFVGVVTHGYLVTEISALLNLESAVEVEFKQKLLKTKAKFIVKTLDDEREIGLELGEDVNSFLISDVTMKSFAIGADTNKLMARLGFDDLNMYDATGEICEGLPTGQLIGLRRTHDGIQERLLLNLLSGELQPDSGYLSIVGRRRIRMVSPAIKHTKLFEASLWENLTYCCGIEPSPSVEQVWQLCQMVGLPTIMLGKTSDSGWQNEAVSDEPVLAEDPEILVRIALVRAILQKPDVLLLCGVGDGWTATGKECLVNVIRGFIDGNLPTDEQVEKGAKRLVKVPRSSTVGENSVKPTAMYEFRKDPTVVLCANNYMLQKALGVDDFLLTLESSSRAELLKVQPDTVIDDSAGTSATLQVPARLRC